MIEKLAGVICVALGDDPDREGPGWAAHGCYGKAARAVLEAMRDPSEAMVEAGYKKRHPMEPIGPNTVAVWQAMIDTALKESSDEG